MSREGILPFDRGIPQTEAGAFDHLVGREYVIEDIDWSAVAQAKPNRSGKYVRLRLVKNASGAALFGKRLVTFVSHDGKTLAGHARATNERCYPLDEFLPAAGLPDGAYGYIVVEGPAVVVTDTNGVAGNVINVGDFITALTATTAAMTNATTGGRATAVATTGATDPLYQSLANRVGRALSAATTANTNADVLCEVGKW